ncbi:MAG: hypothetical protein DRQ47_03580 [Gammaproteobacteria bacterium]|nr:MAG: hypothetical protein DRQ47_03580 [Gammaproteobacteria bacterium]
MDILIKAVTEQHLDALFHLKNNPAVLKNIPGDYPLVQSAFNDKIKKIIEVGHTNNQGSFIIYADQEIIGMIGYFKREDNDSLEVGYYLSESWWGKGIATKALMLLLTQMTRAGVSGNVYACHAAENLASGYVLQKAGFSRDGEVEFKFDDGTSVMDPQWVIQI